MFWSTQKKGDKEGVRESREEVRFRRDAKRPKEAVVASKEQWLVTVARQIKYKRKMSKYS